MVDRLADDHRNARTLAEGLAEIDGLRVDLRYVQTNLVMFNLVRSGIAPEQLALAWAREGVKVGVNGPMRFRAVTHYGITAEDIQVALATMRKVMKEVS